MKYFYWLRKAFYWIWKKVLRGSYDVSDNNDWNNEVISNFFFISPNSSLCFLYIGLILFFCSSEWSIGSTNPAICCAGAAFTAAPTVLPARTAAVILSRDSRVAPCWVGEAWAPARAPASEHARAPARAPACEPAWKCWIAEGTLSGMYHNCLFYTLSCLISLQTVNN